MFGSKSLRIRFGKVFGFIRGDNGTNYLVLFQLEKFDAFYNRIRYLVWVKRGITYTTSHNHWLCIML